MTYEPLHHKYRPQTFADLVGQMAIATTLTNALDQERIAPAYLFTGPRGTGKTSSARILAKSLNCLQSQKPTPQPCGVCEVCRAIASGSALDVIEIDAASNTGVDNIRELIEKAQFAPVQCRYKVYVVDECLVGDSLVLTDQGLIRIDDPSLANCKVLSYNEARAEWEWKQIVRWLDQGKKPILEIQTTHRKIKCTENHLIRTDLGWIPAKNVNARTKILSPVPAAAARLSSNTEPTGAIGDLSEGISSKEIPTGKESITWSQYWNRLSLFAHYVPAAVGKCWKFLNSCNVKVRALAAFNPTGNGIRTGANMGFGNLELPNLSLKPVFCHQIYSDSSMAPSWETVPSVIQTSTVDFPDWLGLMAQSKKHGWHPKRNGWQNYDQNSAIHLIVGTESNPSAVTPLVIPNLQMFSKLLSQVEKVKRFPGSGSGRLLKRDWLGGTWTMARLASHLKEVRRFSFILKDTLPRKINSWLTGLQAWGIQPRQNLLSELKPAGNTLTSRWEPMLPDNGYQTSSSMLFPKWSTSLEQVKSVRHAGVESVYDIEVADNHNFVANGLLVHNCHMLSSSAFNALLKTLEEPPDRVIFVLATTDPQRVLPTIISRCQRFDFRRIPLPDMVQHLGAIARQEAIDISPDALNLVGQIAQGGLRDAESLLDQLSLLSGQITIERVWDLAGAVPEQDLYKLVQAIATDSPEAVLDQARYLMERGREPLIVLQNLASFYRDLLIAKTAPKRNDLAALTPATWQQLCAFVEAIEISTLLAGQQHLRTCELQVKNTTQPRLWLEVALMGLLPGSLAATVPTAAPKLAPPLPSPRKPPPPPAPPPRNGPRAQSTPQTKM